MVLVDLNILDKETENKKRVVLGVFLLKVSVS